MQASCLHHNEESPMQEAAHVLRAHGAETQKDCPTCEPFVMVIFGASGDLTKRLLVPALYNLACDGLLSENFAVLGTAMDAMTTESFRAKLSEDIKSFHTRKEFDAPAWEKLIARFHYIPGSFSDMGVFAQIKAKVAE